MGPRPAGSRDVAAARARSCSDLLPHGRFQAVPGGLRNVVGTVPGREPGYVVRRRALRHQGHPRLRGRERRRRRGTAVVAQLARTLEASAAHAPVRPLRRRGDARAARPTRLFAQRGLRGSKVAAPRYRDARAMVLLDFVGDKRPAHPARGLLRRATCGGGCARPRPRVGVGAPFPGRDAGRSCSTTTSRSSRQGVPVDRPDRLRLPLLAPASATTCPPSRSAAWTRVGETVTSCCLARSLASEPMATAPEKLLLAAPRGYCAGVDRAVQTVERALELYGPPVYVRKEIVHNKHVVEQLRERGAIFVEEETEVPEGETVVFSAHGVAPSVHANAERAQPQDDRRHLPARDQGARRGEEVRRRRLHDRADRPRGPRGGRGHDGRGAGRTSCSSRPRRTSTSSRCADPDRVAFLTQTTLSVDETDRIIRRLRERFPNITGPEVRRHLLRHDEPPGRRPPDGARVRPRARDRLAATRRTRTASSRSPATTAPSRT